MNERLRNALLGALVADAVAMPVHWYYDTAALDRDYAPLNGYRPARNPHPGSILWRSKYTPRNPQADILREQARYWGRRGIHYHQFLGAGENTVNFLLGIELYRSVVEAGRYDADEWLDRYIELMRKPGWHRDTYLEEYHRAFFDRLARGLPHRQCGIEDIHIGGLVPVPFLVAALDALADSEVAGAEPQIVAGHVALTHRGRDVAAAAEALTRMLRAIALGDGVREAIADHGARWASPEQLSTMAGFDDREIVGARISTACYLPDSFTAALHFAWKYAGRFSEGILANARCGGDNCHRGAVVGALLAAANGIPGRWLRGLKSMERLRCDTLDPTPAP